MLIICPEGGLGNRLRVLASALVIQSAHECELRCLWHQQEKVLNAPFSSLFEAIPGLSMEIQPFDVNALRPVFSRHLLRRLLLRASNRLQGIDRYLYEDSSHPGAIADALPEARRFLDSGRVLIRTWQAFADFRSHLPAFQPIPALSTRIAAITAGFDRDIVGVHIRRGDHLTARHHSPLQDFQAWIDNHLQLHPSARFFLCSDDAGVQTHLCRRYGNRIVSPARHLSRDTTEGVQAAVVDLFSLARTERIVGSYHSSFSELAAMIGQIPLHTIHRDGV